MIYNILLVFSGSIFALKILFIINNDGKRIRPFIKYAISKMIKFKILNGVIRIYILSFLNGLISWSLTNEFVLICN